MYVIRIGVYWPSNAHFWSLILRVFCHQQNKYKIKDQKCAFDCKYTPIIVEIYARGWIKEDFVIRIMLKLLQYKSFTNE
jgi:hypothetical protein